MEKKARKVMTFLPPKKKVYIGVPADEDAGSVGSLFIRPSGGTLMGGFTAEIDSALDMRTNLAALDEDGKNVTPKLIHSEPLSERFRQLKRRIYAHEQKMVREGESKFASQSRMGFKLSMDDIMGGIGTDALEFSQVSTFGMELSVVSLVDETDSMEWRPKMGPLPYCKIILGRTEDILLYEQQCMTALRDTEEGDKVEEDNKAYEHITVGKGKLRRRSEADAQTTDTLYKSRDVNTINLAKAGQDSYVSNFEMYDTIQALKLKLSSTKSTSMENEEDEDSVQGSYQHVRANSQFAAIVQSQRFKLSSMLIRRFLASNNNEKGQRRFRDMSVPDPLSLNYDIRYSVNLLFRFEAQARDNERKAVTDLSWCYKNSDIIAAGYGIYSFSAMHVPKSGYACVWSIKNPGNPERIYYFNVPVVCVAFSPNMGALLAVGLYDGSIEVFDITKPSEPPIAVTLRTSMLSCEPVMKIKWIGSSVDDQHEIDPFLAITQSSTVTKHRIINSPHLVTFQQMALERAEGKKEGGPKAEDNVTTQANRHPQGLNLTLHPTQSDIYYVLTDEGCIHKCSTNYPHQHLEVGQAHKASVNNMDFSPWSPVLYLTSGNDWTVRVWLDGVFSPIITLYNTGAMPVHCSYWSRTHSTIIVALNRKTVDIWDLRRSILYPVNSVSIDSSFHTTCKIANSGTTMALGNERGNILVCAFDDLPFQPHMQFDVLEAAILEGVSGDERLYHEVKLRGIQSYPGKRSN